MIATLVMAEFGNFFGIIVFLVVIGRIVGAIKKAASGAGAEVKPTGTKRKIEEDLERFFKNIANQDGNYAVEDVPPPPIPAPARARRKVTPVQRAEPAPPVRRAPPAPIVPAAWGSELYGQDVGVPNRASCTETGRVARTELVAMLKDKDSIRKAVILREILGSPVSMRT